MRTAPPITLPVIAAGVRASHGIDPSSIEFVGGGEIAWGFKVGTASRDVWLKIYTDAEGIDERLAVTDALHYEWGTDTVVAALKTRGGGFTFDVAGHRAALFPYIDGTTWEEQPLTEAQQVELGQLLAQIHSVAPSGFALPLETYEASAADDAEAVVRALPDAANSDHPYRRAMAELLLPVRDLLLAEIARLRTAAVTVARRPQPRYVFCHGDPTDDNVIVSGGRVYLIDWDDMRLAPREFDLMHIAGLPAAMAAYTRSTGRTPDETLLDFYRAKWNNEEIHVYAGRVLFQDLGDEQHQHDLDTMREIVRELAGRANA